MRFSSGKVKLDAREVKAFKVVTETIKGVAKLRDEDAEGKKKADALVSALAKFVQSATDDDDPSEKHPDAKGPEKADDKTKEGAGS